MSPNLEMSPYQWSPVGKAAPNHTNLLGTFTAHTAREIDTNRKSNEDPAPNGRKSGFVKVSEPRSMLQCFL